MKLLILLAFLSSSQLWAQVDIPETPEGKDEIISVLWEKHISDELDPIEFYQLRTGLRGERLTSLDIILLQNIENSFNGNKAKKKKIIVTSLTRVQAIEFISKAMHIQPETYSLSAAAKKEIEAAKAYIATVNKIKLTPKKIIKEVVLNTPDSAYYNNGEFMNTVRLFLFCRSSREYPCLFALKDIFGSLVRKDTGEIWTMPALAKSSRKRPFYRTNGQTPMGVHFMNSVMPTANKTRSFGKFRRVILNFVPKVSDEVSTKQFLPTTTHTHKWWKHASVARDAKRRYLRIHGTGKLNTDPKSSYYPHRPTSGCISVREGKYPGVEYKDQKKVLKTLMLASELLPVYQNHTEIKGVLYVMNIDNKTSKVTAKDLAELGIE